jgi:hypothetical protein
MAISTSSYFSNSIVGVPQVAGELVDIYQTSSTPKFALGTKFERQDGAVFRYAQFASQTSAGMIVASVASDISISSVTSASVTPSSAYQMPIEQPGVYPGAVGSRFIVSIITAAANQFVGAYLSVTSGAGVGYSYRVKGHTVTGDPATGKARFELYDPLIAAVNTSSQISIAGNKYNNVRPVATITSVVACGAAVRTQTGSTFGWVQTKGIAGVLTDVSATLGSAGYIAGVSTADAGAVAMYSLAGTAQTTAIAQVPLVGTVLSIGSGTNYALVDLNMLE